jgi:NADP-dependent 3-hydroxy acid dehydrogenase YdfG
MNLYRAKPKDGWAWVTGASSGIGRNVALDLASQGYRVVATARRLEELEALALEAKRSGGEIIPMAADVTDAAALEHVVQTMEATYGRVVLAFLNAGVYLPTNGAVFALTDYTTSFAVNVNGVLNGLNAVVPRMVAQQCGQIAITSSVVGYNPLPTCAAYGATKAALINMAGCLALDLKPHNVRVQVVNPGFVDTPATAQNSFKMPFLLSPDDAAKRVRRGIQTGGFEITFPKRLSYAMKILNILPWPAYLALMAKYFK